MKELSNVIYSLRERVAQVLIGFANSVGGKEVSFYGPLEISLTLLDNFVYLFH